MFQFADNWKKHIIATRLGSMERAITVFTIEKQISFSVLILIVLLEKKKKESISNSQTSTTYHHI